MTEEVRLFVAVHLRADAETELGFRQLVVHADHGRARLAERLDGFHQLHLLDIFQN